MVGPAGTGQVVLALELLYRLGRTAAGTACVAVGAADHPVGSQPDVGGVVSDPDVAGPNAAILWRRSDEANRALAAGSRLSNGLAGAGYDIVLLLDGPTAEAASGDDLRGFGGLAHGGGSVTVVVVRPVDRTAVIPSPLRLDTTLVFSLEPFALGIFPAVDPVASESDLESPAVGYEVRRLLATARQVRSFFHQPMYVAEAHVGEPGIWVEPTDAVQELDTLLG